MRIPIDIIGGMSAGRSLGNRQECINMYPVVDPTGNKSPKSLMVTPGGKPFVEVPSPSCIRGIQSMKGVIFFVADNKLYRIDGITPVEIATIGTSSGPVFMEDNGDSEQVAICDGQRLYVWSDNSLTNVREAQTMTYQNRYLIITEVNKDIIRWSEPGGDFLLWDETDFIAADALPDAVVRVLSDNNNLWVFGVKSTEPFYYSPGGDPIFQGIANAVSDVGIGAMHSATVIDNTVFWLDDTARVRHAQGYNPTIISTDAITERIEAMTRYDDAIGMTYSGSGHEFYVLAFPTSDVTFVYDIATGVWHQWSSGVDGGRHKANCIINDGYKELVGDYSSGRIYELDYKYFRDGDDLIKRMRTSKTIQQPSGNYIFVNSIELECRVGVGENIGDYTEPKVLLHTSKDNGKTWSFGKYKSLGKLGRWKTRVVWRNLGRGRSFTFRLTVTDPIEFEILGAWAEAEEGTN